MVKQVDAVEIHDENARIVKGWGTVDVFDKVNERLPIEEFKRLMPIIMKRGGIVMNRHTNQPAGRILNYEFLMKDTPEGPKEGVYLTTEVFRDFNSDDVVWKDITDKKTKGFSFGGRNTLEDVEFSKGVSKKTLKGLEGFEFSYVPKGCNQEATIEEVNFIAKEDNGEDGETSQEQGHYHLYRLDASGNGKTLGTLPRETEDHSHNIVSGVVQTTNDHDHKLIRMLVDRVEKNYPKDENKKTEDSEKDDDSDDKTLSKSVSTLNSEGKKAESFIKNNNLSKDMVEDTKVDKVEEVPQAADSNPTEAPVEPMSADAKLDRIIEILSNTVKAAHEDDDKEPKEEEDKDDVEKEGDGEKVKLPESVGDETSQDAPAEGAVTDVASANFLEKEGIEKIKADIKKEILAGLIDKRADTPRPTANTHDITKTEASTVPKNWTEANKMIKAAGKH